jgi:hypothetical protein
MAVTRLGPGGYPVASQGGNTYNVSISEAASAADSPSAAAVFASIDTEAASATDTPSITATFAPAITEAASAADTPSVTAVFASTASEAANATDSPSAVDIAGPLFGMAPLGALPIGTPPQFLFTPFIPPTPTTRDIDAVLTPKQLHALRRRLAREGKRRHRDFTKEAETRADLRKTLEVFFGVAEPEQVEEIREHLPVKAEVRQEAKQEVKPAKFTQHVDWPKLYDDRALMEGLAKDLGKILTEHIARQRFEAEEDDMALLMMIS